MGRSQREKGKRGERELARLLKEYGYDCRRGQQYCGASGDADVVGLPEMLPLNDEILPAVFHRRNRGGWMVTMRLEDWIKQYREWDSGRMLER